MPLHNSTVVGSFFDVEVWWSVLRKSLTWTVKRSFWVPSLELETTVRKKACKEWMGGLLLLPHQKILYSGRRVSGKERSFHDEKGINSLRDIETTVHKDTGIRLCKVPYRVSRIKKNPEGCWLGLSVPVALHCMTPAKSRFLRLGQLSACYYANFALGLSPTIPCPVKAMIQQTGPIHQFEGVWCISVHKYCIIIRPRVARHVMSE